VVVTDGKNIRPIEQKIKQGLKSLLIISFRKEHIACVKQPSPMKQNLWGRGVCTQARQGAPKTMSDCPGHVEI